MLRTLRNVVISIVVMLALFAGAGLAYTKFVAGAPVEETPAATPAEQNYGLPKPKKPHANSRVSASVQSLLSPVKAGANTSMTVKSLPTAKCKIEVTYDDKKSKDTGLTQKVTDDYGNVTWSWTVDKDAPAGTWPAKVTCFFNKKSAVVIGDLKVTN